MVERVATGPVPAKKSLCNSTTGPPPPHARARSTSDNLDRKFNVTQVNATLNRGKYC